VTRRANEAGRQSPGLVRLDSSGVPGDLGDPGRRRRATAVLKRGLAEAEEKYLVAEGATLGTWFARVAETVAVADRVILGQLESGCRVEDEGVAGQQLGVFAAISAEAIRAMSQIWDRTSPTRAREEIVELISASPRSCSGSSWTETLSAVGRCLAVTEPIASGLRDGDLPIGEPTDGDLVIEAFLEVAVHAFQAIEARC
jgi:hypothetical protein